MSELSDGQKVKVLTISILLTDFDVLLLDEPTNNLDIPSTIWLESYLKASKKNIIVVSHDTDFLESICNKVVYLDWKLKTVRVSKGKYSDFLEMYHKSRLQQEINYKNYLKEKKRLESAAMDLKVKSQRGSAFKGTDNDKNLRGFKRERAGKSGRKASTIKTRIENLEKVKRPVNEKEMTMELDPDHLNVSLDIADLKIKAGGKTFGPYSMYLPSGSLMVIVGSNGTGKSTFLDCLRGDIPPYSGRLKYLGNPIICNFSQAQQALIKFMDALDFIGSNINLETSKLHHILAMHGIDEEAATEDISSLSPGQKARVLFAYISALRANVLLLDEPPNHLDLEGQNALISMINEYRGIAVLVTHDRNLLRSVRKEFAYEFTMTGARRIPNLDAYLNSIQY